jgi:PAS domain S-box-containing protein
MRCVSPTAYGDFVRRQELALQGQVSRGAEQRLVDSRGNVYWLRWEMRPWRDASGEITGVVLYADDVSDISLARREAQAQEHKLKIALSAARAAVIETDHKAWAVWSSPELAALTGHDLTGSLKLQLWPFIHPDDVERVREIAGGWYRGESVAPIETRILTTAGEERWIRLYTDIEWDADGEALKTVNLLLDIDERKRQELALVEAQQEAQAAAEAKAQFLANMSHEIRTPMNGVLGVLHLLQNQSLPAEAKSMLGEALACGRMLQAILDDVVDFSRIEAGRLELADEALDPAAMVDGVARLLKPQAEAKGLAMSVETRALPARIWGDPVRLRQCLFNLIGNAVKFTQAGSIVVSATVQDGRLRFEVQDTGIGIDREAQGRLFQRFQQADSTTTRRFGGSGLGLAITSRLAELMDGSVGVSSAKGVGSTFWLEIPARVADAAPAAAADPGGMLDGLRVLVVEDNATNRMIACKILESLGAAAVETADDGEAGVAAAARGGFDLILMDIQMPGIDGVEATRRIRALGGPAATTPVVALTANVLNHQRDTYLAAGMDGVVGKPISPAALLAEIARLAAVEPMDEVAAPATSARS